MTESQLPSPAPSASRGGYLDAGSTALIAFPLAVLCLIGASALSGRTYVLLFVQPASLSLSEKSVQVIGLLVSAAFGAAAFLVARAGLSRLVEPDSSWRGSLLRAAVVLAVLDVVLRLVLVVLVLLSDTPGSVGLLSS